MKEIEIKYLSDNAVKPTRAYGNSAGLDIYASEPAIIRPQDQILLPTDLSINIPDGYVGLLTSRSGVSSKTDLVVETGKIDAGFHGHMKVNIKNDSEKWTSDYAFNADESQVLVKDIEGELVPVDDNGFTEDSCLIRKGEKIAQLLIVPIVTPEVKEVKDFDYKSERGSQGFGSSGY